MTDHNKLEIIAKIIEKAYEYPGGDATSWAGFMEGTLSDIEAVATFKEEET